MVNPPGFRAGLPVNIHRQGILYEKTSVDESNHILKGMRSCHSPFSRRLPLCANADSLPRSQNGRFGLSWL